MCEQRVDCRNSDLRHWLRLDINLDLVVRDNVLDFIVTGQLEVIIVLDGNLVIGLYFILAK